MITDSLSNAKNYNSLNPFFEKSFDFLKTLTPATETGSYEIEPGLKAHVSEYETGPVFKFGWETHRKYIDIQFCLSEKEIIKCAPLSEELAPTIDYDEEKDVRFYTGDVQHTAITIGGSVFSIFFPSDAHAPQIMIGKPGVVKKVVVKVPV